MKDLEVYNLYEGNLKTSESFLENVESNLRIQTEYEKVAEDLRWIEIIENTLPYIDNIFRNPNRFIVNEEDIVKIELARKVTVESIKHLSKNTNLIQEFDKKTGDVRPSKILNINKEESYDTYENRLIYTLVQHIKFYVSQKKKTIELMEDVNEKNDKQIEYSAKANVNDEKINVNVQLNSSIDTGEKNENGAQSLSSRITVLETKISDITSSEVYKIIDKKHIALVRAPIKKTNVILKNVNFQYAMKLWDFLQQEIEETSQHINEKQDYMDDGDLKKLIDETFLLQYLAINTLNKDSLEKEEDNKKIAEEATNQMIERIVDINDSLTEDELKEMIADKLMVIKYRNQANIGEIQKIFKEHIEKYIEKVGSKDV